jgi:hypothetical protein
MFHTLDLGLWIVNKFCSAVWYTPYSWAAPLSLRNKACINEIHIMRAESKHYGIKTFRHGLVKKCWRWVAYN